jgi:hypothetical protein
MGGGDPAPANMKWGIVLNDLLSFPVRVNDMLVALRGANGQARASLAVALEAQFQQTGQILSSLNKANLDDLERDEMPAMDMVRCMLIQALEAQQAGKSVSIEVPFFYNESNEDESIAFEVVVKIDGYRFSCMAPTANRKNAAFSRPLAGQTPILQAPTAQSSSP